METYFKQRVLNSVFRALNFRSLLKYSVVVLICFANLFTSTAFAQDERVSIKVQNKPLSEVLNEIEAKSNYSFLVRNNDVNLNELVTIDASNETVKNILTQLFAKSKVSFEVTGNGISIFMPQNPEKYDTQNSKKVSGLVSDSYNDIIIGATVRLKETTTGTITDINGNFTIEVPNNATLVISSIGFLPAEIKVGNRDYLQVQLEEEITSLDEVYVVGYGTQKKVNLSGAVSQISSKELENRPVANMSQLLQGVAPNMNVTFSSGRPGASGSFNIRGNTSINGGAPLVLIDGVEGSIDRVNPRDVESISILKDASASAVYGARASFGVILVTTKQGASNKTSVSYGTKFGTSKPTTSTDYETRGYYSAKINDDFFRSYAGQNYTKYTDDDYEQLWERRNDKTEHPDRPWVVIDQRDGRDSYAYYANTDWYNFLFDDSRPSQEHSLNINGGNDKTKYYLSGNIFEQKGQFRISPDKYRTTNFRSKITSEVNPWLEISNNTRYFNSDYKFPGSGSVNNLFSAMTAHGLASIPPVNPDGTPVYTTSITNYQVMDGWSALMYNDQHNNRDQTFEFATTFEGVAKLLPGLDIRANYSYSHYNAQIMNRGTNIPYSKYPGEISYFTTGIGQDKLYEKQVNHWYHASNVFANFEKSFNNTHNIKLMAGGNYETKYLKDLGMTRHDLLTTSLNDFNLAVGDVMDITGGQNSYAIMGTFFRANYDYLGRYLFETSGRIDASSRFQRGSRMGFFPSGSVAWRLSEESFFDNLRSEIPNVKIRASYGSLGNQQVGYYDYIQTINTGGTLNYAFGDGQLAPRASVSSPNASDLTWEVVSTKNIGLDFSVFRGRLDFSGDIYSRETKGMLTAGKDLPSAYGAAIPKINSADLRTEGWEISLGWRDKFSLMSKPFNYNARFIISDYTSTITKFDNPTNLLNNYYVGQKLGEMWGYVIDGYFLTDEEAANYPVDQTAVNEIINTSAGSEKGLKAGDLKFVDLDGDNVIRAARTLDDRGDQRVIGNSQPRYNYGFNLGADWQGFDLSVFFQGVGKQNWYPNRNAVGFWGPYSRPYATFIGKDFMSDVWSEDNPNAYFPRPRGYTALSNTNRSLGVYNDKYLQDVAYLRLKNLSVGYSLPKSVLSRVAIERLRIYFSGENLYTFTKLKSKYIDPEQAASGGANGNARVYGWSKTFSLGLDITF